MSEHVDDKRAFNPIPDQGEKFEQAKEEKKKVSESTMKFLNEEFMRTHQVRIIFLMDCTGSMGSWMEQAKENVNNVLTYTQSLMGFAVKDIKIGFLAYRDYDDDKQFEKKDFTDNSAEVSSFIAKLDATGGGDSAEDVVGALTIMRDDFNFSPFGINLAFLICDAPCHGKQYHDGVSDNHADKVPTNTLENLMQSIFQKINNLSFFCLKLTNSTEKMYEIMKNNSKFLKITDELKPENFLNTIKASILVSVMRHGQINRTFEEEKKHVRSGAYTQFKARRLTYRFADLPGEFDNYQSNFFLSLFNKTQIHEDIVMLAIQNNNSAESIEGIQSDVFESIEGELGHEKYMMIKIPRNEDDKKDKAKLYAKVKTRAALIASLTARLFRLKSAFLKDLMSDKEAIPQIFYPYPVVYELLKEGDTEKDFKGCKYIYGEPYFSFKGIDFKKYGNNKFLSLYESFSTFTLQL